jgi:hypothetical protein
MWMQLCRQSAIYTVALADVEVATRTGGNGHKPSVYPPVTAPITTDNLPIWIAEPLRGPDEEGTPRADGTNLTYNV